MQRLKNNKQQYIEKITNYIVQPEIIIFSF